MMLNASGFVSESNDSVLTADAITSGIYHGILRLV